jgi:hypothetical protein
MEMRSAAEGMQANRRRMSFVSGVSLALAGLASGCTGQAGAREGTLETRVDTIGDTITVRTVSGRIWKDPAFLVEEIRIGTIEGRDEEMLGSVAGLAAAADGSVYVYDRQVPALRHYGPDGAFVATLGGKGGGPGEYSNSDGGLAVLPDGRVVLRDPGNARFTLWNADGSYDSEWLGRGGFFTSTPLYTDSAGHVYTTVIREARDGERVSPGSLWVTRLARIGPDGITRDTLDLPDYGYDPPVIVARREGGTSMNTVPFSPGFHWTLDPGGRFIAGVANRYAVDVQRPDGSVLRLGRDIAPPAVGAAEKAAAEDRATWSMRRTLPDWRWNGPPIPDTKPFFKELFAGRDGRIWVQLSTPAETVPDDGSPQDPERPPPVRFREPVVFDVFEADGRYLGEVRAPAGFSTTPKPVISGDHVWAVMRDELEVSYVVRYHIDAGDPDS